ncbi:MAG: DUF2378 family protein [Chloroflexota bacterium]|nr:DUF2378 family protein [Chloroflexota bacterium]
MSDTISSKVKRVYIEAAIKGTGALNNPTLMQEVKALYDPKQPKATYSKETFQRLVDLLRQRLYPELSNDEALFDFGRKVFKGYCTSSTMGSMMLPTLKFMSPVRLISLAKRLLEDAGLGQCNVEQVTECKCLAHYHNFLFAPHGVAGAAIEGLITSGAKKVRYHIEALTSLGAGLYNFDIVYEWN